MSKLLLSIHSFGYRKSGIPGDTSDNNGGFVFDCRALPNPGREESFRLLTGLDTETREYLQAHPTVAEYLELCRSLIQLSVDEYSERGFTRLMVSFGCTGGQHRSVYCAYQTALYFQNQGINVELVHHDLPVTGCV